jgi:hypothetical protein
MLQTLENQGAEIVSRLTTIHTNTNNCESMLDTTHSMLATTETEIWIIDSRCQTLNTFTDNVESMLDTDHSMLNTQEIYSEEIISRCKTIDSHVMIHTHGLGTGQYYFNQDGYWRNTTPIGHQILWTSSETGAVYVDGTPTAGVTVVAFVVTGGFSGGVRATANWGIAYEGTTDVSGNYEGYLDPGVYDFYFYKTNVISEYHRRQLTEA